MSERQSGTTEPRHFVLDGVAPASPKWFDDALAAEPEPDFVLVDGVPIETLSWGDPGRPVILFVHGSMAHARWWTFLAPFFLPDYRVVALSLSGMGRSGWREHYDIEVFRRDLLGVIAAQNLGGTPLLLAAHSAGAETAILLAARDAQLLTGFAIIDSGFEPASPLVLAKLQGRPDRRFSTREAAMARYRFTPPQPCQNLFIVDWLARTSLMKTDDRNWRWLFDPDLWRNFTPMNSQKYLGHTGCPVASINGLNSAVVTREVLARLRALLPAGTVYQDIADAYHHVMLDQPLALVAALRERFDDWLGISSSAARQAILLKSDGTGA